MIVRSWKSKNNSVYADFKKRIDAIVLGDISVLEQMFGLAKDCIPQEVLDLYVVNVILTKKWLMKNH